MQFIDLALQQKRIKDKIDANIAAILDHGKYIMGPEIGILENRLAEYCDVNHAIGCASGTDALLMVQGTLYLHPHLLLSPQRKSSACWARHRCLSTSIPRPLIWILSSFNMQFAPLRKTTPQFTRSRRFTQFLLIQR